MNSSLQSIPFEDLGPSGRYWLGAFDPSSPLHAFLPIGAPDSVPDPGDGIPFLDRGKLVQTISSFNLPLSATQNRALERLADPRALCVVTGQQPGLAGGPLYTFNKILSAIVFARKLETHWGRPVIPLLWDGGEDHDYAEIGHLDWLSHDGGPHRFEIPPPSNPDRPAFSLPFTEEHLASLLDFIRSVHPPTDRRESLEAFLEGVKGSAETWTDFFDGFWLRIFENHPLLVYRPWGREARSTAIPLFEREILDPEACHREVAETSARLEQEGFKPQIHKKEGVCSFFHWDGVARRTVTFDSGSFRITGTDRVFDRDSLLAELHRDPTAFSPNALLRPVLQDALLPIAATVLGPSEIAYHAQLGGVFERHGVRRSTVLPRFSITLQFPKHRQMLEEFGLSLKDLLRDDGDLLKQIVRSDFLEQGLASLGNLRTCLDETQTGLLSLAAERPGELRNPIQKQFGTIGKTLSQVEDLLRRDEMKLQTHQKERLAILKQTLLPEGGLQERVYGVLPFLARYGKDWIDSLVETAVGWDGASHYVHLLGGENE